MAELQRYNPTGLGLASLPGLPTVEPIAMQERIRETQGLSASLDRISQFAFKEAAEEAKRQGMEYGAENQITPEQAKAALVRDVNPKNLLVKSGTYFGDAARAIQISQLRVALEVDARNKLVDIENDVDKNPNVDLDKVKSEINSFTNGYAAILSKMDAEEAIRFKQSVAAAGNQTYRIAARKSIEIENAAKQADYESARTNLPFRISGILNESPPELIVDMINVELSVSRSAAAKTGSATVVLDDRKYTSEVLNKAIADKVLDPTSSMTVSDAITSIKKGTHPALSRIVKDLKLDTNKIEELILAQADQNKKAGEFFYYQQDKIADAIERRIYSSTDPKVHKQAFEELSKLPINASRINTARNFIYSDTATGPQRDDLTKVAQVLQRIATSDITYQEVIAMPGLTRETRVKFMGMIINPQDDISRGVQEIRLSAGYQGANLPPEIKDDVARKLVTDARNRAEVDLMTYGRSMIEIDGVKRAPTPAEIKAKATELAQGTSVIYGNAMVLAADKTKAGIALMLPSLANVDLNKQADVDKAINDAIAAKTLTPKSATQVRIEVETWRKNTLAASGGGR
jgi:hypothetical protein